MASKAGNGFFHFFDWTRKSRNKLLADGSASIGKFISSYCKKKIFFFVFCLYKSYLAKYAFLCAEERVQRKVNNEDETPDSQPHLVGYCLFR